MSAHGRAACEATLSPRLEIAVARQLLVVRSTLQPESSPSDSRCSHYSITCPLNKKSKKEIHLKERKAPLS
jgi:hypothetical protein